MLFANEILMSDEGPQIDEVRVVNEYSFHVVIRFHPAEKVLRGDQLHAYNKYLARIAEELSLASLPALNAIDISMEITPATATYNSPEWTQQLGARLQSMHEKEIARMRAK